MKTKKKPWKKQKGNDILSVEKNDLNNNLILMRNHGVQNETSYFSSAEEKKNPEFSIKGKYPSEMKG